MASKKHVMLGAVLSAAAAVAGTIAVEGPASAPPALEVRFSPLGGCTAEVVADIAAARKFVHVLAYSFTSKPIADALAAAKRRGVDVQVVLDKGQPSALGNQIATLRAAGVPVWIDHKHAIAHNKVVGVDGVLVETGSFNFTAAAEASNGENALTIRDAALAAKYEADFQKHKAHSEPLK